jgi:PKD repeat protein
MPCTPTLSRTGAFFTPSSPIPNSNDRIASNGSYAFVVDSTADTLRIYNVTVPSSPTLLSINSSFVPTAPMYDVVLVGNKLLIAAGSALVTYDVTNVLNGGQIALPPALSILNNESGIFTVRLLADINGDIFVGINSDFLPSPQFNKIRKYNISTLIGVIPPVLLGSTVFTGAGVAMTLAGNFCIVASQFSTTIIRTNYIYKNSVSVANTSQVGGPNPFTAYDIAGINNDNNNGGGALYLATSAGIVALTFSPVAGIMLSFGPSALPDMGPSIQLFNVNVFGTCLIVRSDPTDNVGTLGVYDITARAFPIFSIRNSNTNSLAFSKPFVTATKVYAATGVIGGNSPVFGVYDWTCCSGNAPPTASFTFDTTGTQATFTDTSTGSPTSWAWNFGDPDSGASNTSSLQNPTHTFSGYDAYTVTLTATNGIGASTPFQDDVTTSPPPTASFTFNTVNKLGTFTDTSTDSPTSWSWNFGDPASNANNTSTLQNPTHTFTSYANYTVTLTSSNSNGSSEPFQSVVTTTPPPIGSFTFEVLGKQGTFTDTSTGAPTSWAWNFGDPDSGANNTSTVQNPIHVFSGFDTYTVTLTATNGNGSSSPFQDDVTTESTTPPFRFTINFGIPTRAPGSGTVQMPFTGYYEDNSPVDITLAQYSLNGTLFQNASALSSSDTDDLVFGPDGVGHVFNWKASEDLGNDLFNKTIYFKMQATSPEFVSSISETTFTIVKVTTTGSKKDEVVFPGSYKGTSGNSILGIFKGSK